jgi:hypothetical protein
MKVLEDRVLRRIFGVQEPQETGEKCIMGSFTFFTLHHIGVLFG